ncbi:hypothetical protein [Moorella sulfitireducens (nom. illeg.)]|uniref:hypothetical protein n=1 Tax=Neomoorella sulfitireducens TaxID=2972948 RepID=UPI0021AC9778|nr:hypothetical protein [Moorella sulfitireducens]
MASERQKPIDARLKLANLELQVALLARAGLKRWEIATALGLQQGTVKSQLERVANKLGPNWKGRPDIIWPELEEEVLHAIKSLQEQNKQEINFNYARMAMEGSISPDEAAILQLQGVPSPAGTAYLRRARAVQWHLLLLGDGRVLHVGAAPRFWIKPALTFLADSKYIRYLHSDNGDDPYRPWWLPYTTGGRVRGTKAAYYKLGDASAGDYVSNYLQAWLEEELVDYVTRLYSRIQQRWLALSRIARNAGRKEPEPPPTQEELLLEARQALGTS